MIVFLFYFTFNDLYSIRELFLVYFVTECDKKFMPFGWGVKKVFFSKQENWECFYKSVPHDILSFLDKDNHP